MSITQDRLHRLLLAGEAYQALWGYSRRYVAQLALAAQQGQTSYEEALNKAALTLQTTPANDAQAILMAERIRYNLTHARNDSERERKERARRRQGRREYLPAPDPTFAPGRTGRPQIPVIDPSDDLRSAQDLALQIQREEDEDGTAGYDSPLPAETRAEIDEQARAIVARGTALGSGLSAADRARIEAEARGAVAQDEAKAAWAEEVARMQADGIAVPAGIVEAAALPAEPGAGPIPRNAPDPGVGNDPPGK